MQVTNTRVYGLEESILASGYPMLSKPYTEEEFKKEVVDMFTQQGECKYENKNIFEENKHFKRFMKLSKAKAGSGHDCALKGVIVQMDVTAPQYFWQQLQRYHFIDFVSSNSKMHCITKFDLDKQVDNSVSYEALKNLKEYIDLYQSNKCSIDDVLKNVPMGLNLTARLTTNYLQLKTIYSQRKAHRSQEWHIFCDWIKTLPYAKELITHE